MHLTGLRNGGFRGGGSNRFRVGKGKRSRRKTWGKVGMGMRINEGDGDWTSKERAA
jgi:hypothetical protein